MSEDEAFVRAVVDGRGDDTVRLVYADWLDDRDDPRGPYLRAEAQWARTGEKEKALRSLARKLDPVWVARVSRPPVGICADKIVMRTEHPPLTAADLDAVEEQLEITLPAEYRALFMNWNGAAPSLDRPRDPRDHCRMTDFESFHRIVVGKKPHDQGGPWDLVDAVQQFREDGKQFAGQTRVSRYTGRIETLPDPSPYFIPIASGEEYGFYFVCIRGKDAGKVAYLDEYGHEGMVPSDLGVCFPSLGAMLASMIDGVPDWYRHIKNGDTAGLLAWITAGGDVNARYAPDDHPKYTQSLLEVAVRENKPAMVRQLRLRGAKETPEAREAVGFLRGPAKQKMRAALATEPAPKKPAPKKPAPKKRKK